MDPQLARSRATTRIEARLDRTGECWLWTGARREGYGKLSYRVGQQVKNLDPHRAMYEKYVGPIPDGMQIHHRCGVRHCARPEHLELLTPRENYAIGEPCVVEDCRCRCHKH